MKTIRNFAGGSTSAGKMNKRVGIADTNKVRVEGGRLIAITTLCREFNEAADQFLNRRNRPSRLQVYQMGEAL